MHRFFVLLLLLAVTTTIGISHGSAKGGADDGALERRINKELDEKSGFQPVQVASGLDWERYAAVSVRLPDMPGVSPRQGFSRRYPAGAAVGHLIGYVGTASKEEYDESKDPLLITPGFKIGKDGLESAFEQDLKGKPGAKRVEVTASGKIVQELLNLIG